MNIFTSIYNEVVQMQSGQIKTYQKMIKERDGSYSGIGHLFTTSGYLTNYMEIIEQNDVTITIKRL